MLLKKEDVWADLRYALDELGRPSRDIHSRLTDAANLEAQSFEEFSNRLLLIGSLSIAYSRAKMRADTRNAHEAIEKGLKTILLDSGRSDQQVRSRGHELHQLLADVQQHNPTAFNELERCFDNIIRYLSSVTTIQHNTNIVDYFQEHGKAEIFVANRYASIEGNVGYGMIPLVYDEILLALLSLIFGWTPQDMDSRIEEEVKKAIWAESKCDLAWNATEWLSRGPVRPRLEVIENLNNNKVLLAAVRKCARESRDRSIQSWAKALRRRCVLARREVRAEHRVGGKIPHTSLS